jgi:hypothetical protein
MTEDGTTDADFAMDVPNTTDDAHAEGSTLRRGRSAVPAVVVKDEDEDVKDADANDADEEAGRTKKPLSHSAAMARVRRELKTLASREPYYACETWRRTPFDALPYETLRTGTYCAGADVSEEDAGILFDRFVTSVSNGWTDYVAPAPVEEGKESASISCQPTTKKLSEHRLDLTRALGEPLRVGVDVEERPLWGMDCYTREAVFASISVVEHYDGEENLPRRIEYLEKYLLPKLHTLGEDGWDMALVARLVMEDALASGEEHVVLASKALLKAITILDDVEYLPPPTKKVKKAKRDAEAQQTETAPETAAPETAPESTAPGTETETVTATETEEGKSEPVDPRFNRVRFRLHPKGTGVVCINKNGLPAGTFVNYYVGEIFPPWKWYERQDAIKKCFPNMDLPTFFNITLERPAHDERGRHTIFVDAMHKGCFASRLSHSCEPNCQTVTFAKDGKLWLGMFTTHDIAYGEEMTWDYSCITESAEEFRSGYCLCSSPKCRGSFLTYAGSGAFTAVMSSRHAFLHRNAILFKASTSPVTDLDRTRLHEAGIRACALDGCPDWLVKWAALTLEYIRLEEKELPQTLMNLPATEFGGYNELGAKYETMGVTSTRFTNLVVTLDKVRYVLNRPDQIRTPMFIVLTEDQVIDHLWSGEESVIRRLMRAWVTKSNGGKPKALKNRGRAPSAIEPSSDPVTKLLHEKMDVDSRPTSANEARRRILQASALLRSLGNEHTQAADCLWFYGKTKNFFTAESYKLTTSPPVNIDDVKDILPGKHRADIPSVFRGKKHLMLAKKYGPTYAWGQLVTWFKQTIYAPDASLSADRRGTLSLPDPESAYSAAPAAYTTKERKSLIKMLRQSTHTKWPTVMSWSFKNPTKVYGTPMFDDALRTLDPEQYANGTSTTVSDLINELEKLV